MTKTRNSIVCVLLGVIMLLGLFPGGALAQDTYYTGTYEVEDDTQSFFVRGGLRHDLHSDHLVGYGQLLFIGNYATPSAMDIVCGTMRWTRQNPFPFDRDYAREEPSAPFPIPNTVGRWYEETLWAEPFYWEGANVAFRGRAATSFLFCDYGAYSGGVDLHRTNTYWHEERFPPF